MTHLNERGVTLIELLVAIMLLAIALTGLASSYPLAMQAVTGGGFQTTATLLAQQCVELAKSMPYDRIPLDLAGSCPTSPTGYPGFTRSVTVTTASPTATTTTVTVSVDFRSTQGVVQTSVATILAQ
ncbi:MAG TPA: type II secretion system protein [Streptosporangiaceae bacterium]